MSEPFVVVELLGHPRGKGRPRRDRLPNGGYVTHTDAKTREFEGNLQVAASQAMRGQAPLAEPLRVVVEAAFPIPASWSGKRRGMALAGELAPAIKPDWNNLGGVTDALNGVVWVDDRQIVSGTVIKFYSDRPRLVISVWPQIHGTIMKRYTESIRKEAI